MQVEACISLYDLRRAEYGNRTRLPGLGSLRLKLLVYTIYTMESAFCLDPFCGNFSALSAFCQHIDHFEQVASSL